MRHQNHILGWHHFFTRWFFLRICMVAGVNIIFYADMRNYSNFWKHFQRICKIFAQDEIYWKIFKTVENRTFLRRETAICSLQKTCLGHSSIQGWPEVLRDSSWSTKWACWDLNPGLKLRKLAFYPGYTTGPWKNKEGLLLLKFCTTKPLNSS